MNTFILRTKWSRRDDEHQYTKCRSGNGSSDVTTMYGEYMNGEYTNRQSIRQSVYFIS